MPFKATAVHVGTVRGWTSDTSRGRGTVIWNGFPHTLYETRRTLPLSMQGFVADWVPARHQCSHTGCGRRDVHVLDLSPGFSDFNICISVYIY